MKVVGAPNVIGVDGRVPRAVEAAVGRTASRPTELVVTLRPWDANAVRFEQA